MSLSPDRPCFRSWSAIVSDTTEPRVDASHLLAGCLQALARSGDVAAVRDHRAASSRGVEGWRTLKARFPDVSFLPVPDVGARRRRVSITTSCAPRASPRPGATSSALLEDHARPDPRWCANVARRIARPYACVGGAIGNLVDRPLNWAVYFCDFGQYQNPLPAGETPIRLRLQRLLQARRAGRVRSVWRDAFREVIVNDALRVVRQDDRAATRTSSSTRIERVSPSVMPCTSDSPGEGPMARRVNATAEDCRNGLPTRRFRRSCRSFSLRMGARAPEASLFGIRRASRPGACC